MGQIVHNTANVLTMEFAAVLLAAAAVLLGTTATTVNMVCKVLQILILSWLMNALVITEWTGNLKIVTWYFFFFQSVLLDFMDWIVSSHVTVTWAKHVIMWQANVCAHQVIMAHNVKDVSIVHVATHKWSMKQNV